MKYEITKEQIEILKKSSTIYVANSHLTNWFPEVVEDKTKLKESLWYKSLDYPKWMLCVTNVNFKEKRVKGYGFGSDGNWMGNAQNDSWEFNEFDRCVQATESEVFEALKNEAVKRYNDGDMVGCLYDKKTHLLREGNCMKSSVRFYLDSYSQLWSYSSIDRNVMIFKEGQWAEIIETITKAEAEKLLNKKIILP